jgi:hypothetical protein
MNYGRLISAAVAATVVDVCYGFLVYGMLLASEFERYPGVYRPSDVGMTYLPLMFAGIFVAMLVASMIYAKGYEGGSGVSEGGRFGALLGVFLAAVFVGVNYATLNIGRKISAELAVAGLVEWTLIGVVIGLVYKPAATAARR